MFGVPEIWVHVWCARGERVGWDDPSKRIKGGSINLIKWIHKIGVMEVPG